jgi:hypothetical protein
MYMKKAAPTIRVAVEKSFNDKAETPIPAFWKVGAEKSPRTRLAN